eukprot:SAG22_NODE_7308_length_753_cov_0.711009_1_plen_199_part_01
MVTPDELAALDAEINRTSSRSEQSSTPRASEPAGGTVGAPADQGAAAGSSGGDGGGGADEATVGMLVGMGYSRQEVLTALQLSQNNPDAAVGLLLEGGLDSAMQAGMAGMMGPAPAPAPAPASAAAPALAAAPSSDIDRRHRFADQMMSTSMMTPMSMMSDSLLPPPAAADGELLAAVKRRKAGGLQRRTILCLAGVLG